MSEQYIRDTADWAIAFNLACSEVEEFVFDDGDEAVGILAFRVRFASGNQVVALSSRPKNLRSKKGQIRIDEAAFHDDLDELLKAAIAILMWGGSVAIWSTHNGHKNPFNRLVEKIAAKELSYSLHRVTLKDAIADGLYRRVCLMSNRRWSAIAEQEWTAQLYQDYGPAAAEELDVIPFAGGEGSVFQRGWFNIISESLQPLSGRTCRFWDIAATSKQLAKSSHYFTAGTKMRRSVCGQNPLSAKHSQRSGDRYTILHSLHEQVGPAEVETLILKTAQADGRQCLVRWELEGGSNAKIFADGLQKKLRSFGFNADYLLPRGDKVTRAMPFATEAFNNRVDLVEGVWNEKYLDCCQAFDGTPRPLVNDVVDSSSGCYSVLSVQSAPQPNLQPPQRDLQSRRVF
jgi:predicted phage terminase large subunit-like protein